MPTEIAPSGLTVGRYVLSSVIAAGGMATVHLGRVVGAAGFTRVVAIKRLHPHFAKDPEFVSMFLDEARLAARVRHPNVVPVLDVEQHDGELFLVMEYVHGESLSSLLRAANGPMPPRMALAIAAGVLHGLHAAHETVDGQGRPLGIVHRDVSPQNILVGVDGVARLLDFGVAKTAWRLQTTREGQLKGKLSYMAPEQVQGAVIDRRVDVYAASIVLWELLSSARLYPTREPGDVILRILASAVDPPSAHNADVPAEIDALVLRGLSRNPQRRFATAREMASAIESAMPLASAPEIGEWVQALAGDVLAARATSVAMTERGEIEPVSVRASPDDVATAPATGAYVASNDAKSVRRPVGPQVAAAGALVIAATASLGAYVALGRASSARAPSAPALAASSPDAKEAPPDPSAPPATAPQAAMSPAPPTHPRRAPSHSTTSRKKSCDPPYYVDPRGIHVPKPECLE